MSFCNVELDANAFTNAIPVCSPNLQRKILSTESNEKYFGEIIGEIVDELDRSREREKERETERERERTFQLHIFSEHLLQINEGFVGCQSICNRGSCLITQVVVSDTATKKKAPND